MAIFQRLARATDLSASPSIDASGALFEELEPRLLLTAAITGVSSDHDDFRFVAGEGIPAIQNTYNATLTGDATSVVFELDGQEIPDTTSADGWSATFNMSALTADTDLLVTAYSGADPVDSFAHEVDLVLLPEWFAQENVDYSCYAPLWRSFGYSFPVFVKDLDYEYTTPEDWVWTPGRWFEEPLVDLSGLRTALEAGWTFCIRSFPNGTVGVYQTGYTGRIEVLGEEIWNHTFATGVSDDFEIGDAQGRYEVSFDPHIGNDLEWVGLVAEAELNIGIERDFTLFEIPVPVGPSVPGLAALAEVEFGMLANVGFDFDSRATLTLTDDGTIGLSSAEFTPSFHAGLTGYAEVNVGDTPWFTLAKAGVRVGGTVTQDFTLTYSDAAWSGSCPGSLVLAGSVYWDTVLDGLGGEYGLFSWTIAEWNPCEDVWDPGQRDDDPTQPLDPDVQITDPNLSQDEATPTPVDRQFQVTAVAQDERGILPDSYTFTTWRMIEDPVDPEDRWADPRQWGPGDGTETIGPFGPGTYRLSATALTADERLGGSLYYFDVSPAPVPDLHGSITARPEETPNGEFMLDYVVRNSGGIAASSVEAEFILSRDDLIGDDDDVPLGQIVIPVVGPNESSEGSAGPFLLPEEGYYYVAMVIDPVPEEDDTNNIALGTVLYDTPAPDYGIDEVRLEDPDHPLPDPVRGTSTIWIYARTVNHGPGNASHPAVTKFYLSPDPEITGRENDIYVGGYSPVPPLDAHQHFDKWVEIPLLGHVSAGEYYVGAIADTGQHVAEHNEQNNAGVSNDTLTVIAPSIDYVVDSVSVGNADYPVPDPLYGDSVIWVGAAVSNAGDEDSSEWSETRFFISPDPEITGTGNDAPLGVSPTRPLDAHDDARVAIYKRLPDLDAGDYWIGAIADARGAISEYDEGNHVTLAPDVFHIGPILRDGFGYRRDYAVEERSWDVASGDFNGDGHQDLLIGYPQGLQVRVLPGRGDGSFEEPVDYPIGLSPFEVAVADFNADGMDDIATTTAGWDSVAVRFGPDFSQGHDYEVDEPRGVIAADFNKDGAVDIAAGSDVGGQDDQVKVFANQGDGTFELWATEPAGELFLGTNMATGDFNGDSHVDIAIANRGTDWVTILWGKTGDGFSDPSKYPVGRTPYGITAGHFDGDPYTDLAVSNAHDDSISVLYGSGSGLWNRYDYAVGNNPYDCVATDFDGNGNLDLVVANHDASANNVTVLFGEPDGSFPTRLDYPVGHKPRELASVDFNEDGRPDLAALNSGDADVSVALWVGNNRPPSVTLESPAWGVTLNDPTPRFSWSPADPDGDPVSGVLYLSNDGTPFTDPLAVWEVGDDIDYTLKREEALLPGTYSWGVRVADGVFLPVLSDARSFTMSPDLVFPSPRQTITASPEESVNIQLTVKNAGSAAVSEGERPDQTPVTRVYLSSDRAFDGDEDLLLVEYPIGRLDGGASFTSVHSFNAPADASTQYLLVVADPTNRLNESDEWNNWGEIITLEVRDDGQSPEAGDDMYGTEEGVPLVVEAPGVLGNDSDPDGDPLTVRTADTTSAAGGIVTVNEDGSFTYDPNGQFEWLAVGETATDTFQYTASDGNSGDDTATVIVTIHGRDESANVVELQIDLHEDNSGLPGAEITDDTVYVGQSFFVVVKAADLRSVPAGLVGLAVDLDWQADLLDEIDDPFDLGSALICEEFELYRQGTLDQTAGFIENLSGGSWPTAGMGEAIGVGTFQTFSVMHFEVEDQVATGTPLELTLGDNGISLADGREDFTVVIEAQTLTILKDPRITVADSSGDPDDEAVQFTTARSEFNPGATDSTLVRPAYPDEKQYIDVTNTATSELTLYEIQIAAPDVTITPALTDDFVLQAGETQRFELVYAPTLPSLADPTAQKFDLADGLVILSNAGNAPVLEIALQGASTFNSDITHDGAVNLGELGPLNANFGKIATDVDFDPTTDINGDGAVNLGDVGLLNVEFGRQLPTTTAATTAASASSSATAPPESAAMRDASVQPLVPVVAPEEDVVAYYEGLAMMAGSWVTEDTPKPEDTSVAELAAAEDKADQPEDGGPLSAATAETTDAGITLEAGYLAPLPENPSDTSGAIGAIAVMVNSLDYWADLDGSALVLADSAGRAERTGRLPPHAM